MVRKIKKVLSLGITGGIGSGQTSVANMLRKKNAYIVDADRKGREVLEKYPELLQQLRTAFGNEIFTTDGVLDRAKLGSHVFSSRQMLEKLNRIIHPRMVELIINELEEARLSGKYKVVGVDAALIYEIQMESIFDKVLCVNAPMPERLERVHQRNKLPKEKILERIGMQIPLEEKSDWTDYTILNNGNLDLLKEKVEVFWEIFKKK